MITLAGEKMSATGGGNLGFSECLIVAVDDKNKAPVAESVLNK